MNTRELRAIEFLPQSAVEHLRDIIWSTGVRLAVSVSKQSVNQSVSPQTDLKDMKNYANHRATIPVPLFTSAYYSPVSTTRVDGPS